MGAVMIEAAIPGAQLGSALAAYGLLRVVGEQADRDAWLYWHPLGPILHSRFDAAGLVDWLLDEYTPTPVVSPWLAGSGFGLGWTPAGAQKTSTRTCAEHDQILALAGPRLAEYADSIRVARKLVDQARTKGWSKLDMLLAARAWLPDAALAWVDTAVAVLDSDGEREAVYNPLLGSGGNVGSADLSVLYTRHVLAALGLDAASADRATRAAWCRFALSGQPSEQAPLVESTGVHLFPGWNGLMDPWSWVLAIEGACALAGSAAARSAPEPVAFPTAVTTTQDSAGGMRGETWLPIWLAMLTWPEARSLITSVPLYQRQDDRGPARPARTGLQIAAGGPHAPGLAGALRYVHTTENTIYHCRYTGAHIWSTLQPDWLSIADVAQARGVTPSTIRSYLTPGSRSTIPPPDERQGRVVRWRAGGPIDAWMYRTDTS